MRAALPRAAVQGQCWPGGKALLRYFTLQPWGLKNEVALSDLCGHSQREWDHNGSQLTLFL